MRILIIDNKIDRESWGSQDLCRLARLVPGATIAIRRAPEGDLPDSPAPYDRIIVSGSKTSALEDSPWIDRLMQFILKSVELKKPFLGVCYGHQMLSRALGGSKEFIRKSETPEVGWTQIRIHQPSILFQSSSIPLKTTSVKNGLVEDSSVENSLAQNGLDQSKNFADHFYSFSSHFEEVAQLPPGMRCLASSQACEIQACQLGDLPIFGIQFHPEKNLKEANETLKHAKTKGQPEHLLNASRGKELYNPKIGEALFTNFLTTSLS